MQIFSCYLIGNGTLLQECGEVLLRGKHDILGVITSSGRLADWASANGCQTIDASSDFRGVLADSEFDYLFSIAYLQIIPADILDLPRHGAINFHDGPLPRYAGLNAPAWAIMNGESSYGICWHRMTTGVDEGAILKRENFSIEPDDTSVSLNTRNLLAGVRTFSQLVEELAKGEVCEEPQDLTGRSYFGRFDRPDAAGVLDWRRSADELDRQVRGLQFGDYENPLGSPKIILHGTSYAVVRARTIDFNSYGAAPGTIIGSSESSISVATGDGSALELVEISNLRGESMNFADLQVQPGQSLELLTNESRDVLTSLDQRFSRSERFWRDRLSSLHGVEPLLARRKSRQRGAAVSNFRRRIELPDTVLPEHPRGIVCLALFAMLHGRIQREFEFDLALRDRSWSGTIRGLESFVAEDLCIRVDLDPEQNFQSFLASIDAEINEVRDRGGWLRDLVMRHPSLRRNTEWSNASQLGLGVVFGSATDAESEISYPLTLELQENGTAPVLAGNSDYYNETAIDAIVTLIERLGRIVDRMGSGTPLRSIPLLENESRELRSTSKWESAALGSSREIYSRIERQIDETPDREAVCFEDKSVTYQQLGVAVDQLSERLKAAGVGSGELVGIHISRSIEMVVAVLSVFKCGCAYVPLDPEFPPKRLDYMIENSGLNVVISESALMTNLRSMKGLVLCVDREEELEGHGYCSSRTTGAVPEGLAYVMYTSGSTGQPKGVMVTQRNLLNFFEAMDECIDHDPPGRWLAITSLSFDISILELFWTLTRGFSVVLQGGMETYFSNATDTASTRMAFSLFMWGDDDAPGRDKYKLMLEGAKFFDRNGFDAVYTPERHFHAFGGPYPNPAVTSAAIAAITENIGIRAGSCVSPLHHPIRIAEEWSVVDNLSDGRVGLSFASGWHPNDFVLRPENHENNKAVMFEQIDQVRRLWRGEKLEFPNPLGETVEVETLPKPVQSELPVWVTAAGNPDTYRQAGLHGANVLTHLLGQTLDELTEKIAIYRQARASAGLDPATGQVTLMLHTFVGESDSDVRDLVREPMKQYLRSSLRLALNFAWSFPAFKRPGDGAEMPEDVDIASLPADEVDSILDFAFERYFDTSGLFGSKSTCLKMIERCRRAGVDEIACLLDFGVATDTVLSSLPNLNEVRKATNVDVDDQCAMTPSSASHTIAGLIEQHKVTHVQCTPSLARMMLMDEPTRRRMASLPHFLVGGEELTTGLARELGQVVGGTIRNMYGPTETTIWSTSHEVEEGEDPVSIGRPVANTQVFLLDSFNWPVPEGLAGELYIGGAGVAAGYLNRPDLTRDRFVRPAFVRETDQVLYRTGDLARLLPNGDLEFLGRCDHQVKVRGHRIELEEIERALDDIPLIGESAVVLSSLNDTDARLIAYMSPASEGTQLNIGVVRAHLEAQLPDYMVPGEFVVLERLPHTPNRKVDRKALPAPERTESSNVYVAPCTPTEETLAVIWGDVLKLKHVGREDDFFELGGHSLLVMQVVSRVRETFNVELPLRDLFAARTIESLGRQVEALRSARLSETQVDALSLRARSSNEGRVDVRIGREEIKI